jgi:hypothetical protein
VLLYGKNPTDHGQVVGEQQHDLDADADCAETARHAVTAAMASWGLADEGGVASLCVSELVTALRDGHPDRLELRVRCGEHSVRVLIRPQGATREVHELLSDQSASHSFTMVDRLAPFWGVLPRPSGEVVWVEFPAQSRQ